MILLDKIRPHIFGNNIEIKEAKTLSDIPNELGYFGAIDVPRKTDWIVDERHVAHFRRQLPNNTNLVTKTGLIATNQGLRGSCTAFMTNSSQWIANTLEHDRKIYTDPNITWDKYQIPTGASDNTGDTLQNAYLQLRKHAPIDLETGMELPILEFRRLANKNPETLMRWLAMNRPLCTGIYLRKDNGKSNMAASYENDGIVDLEAGYTVGGHAVLLVGYEYLGGHLYFRLWTHWGSNWGFFKDGTFLVDSDQMYKTMSATVFFDPIDVIS